MRIALLALGLMLLAPAFAGQANAAQAARRDWSAVVGKTPAGAYVMGNPDAKVKLVEYASLTCPHCARFAADAYGPLKTHYIRSGQVSLELRHAIRDRFDLAATLLARCQGPKGVFPTTEALFAGQQGWLDQGVRWEEGDGAQIGEVSPEAGLALAAKGAGLDRIIAARGFPAARMTACFADKAEQSAVAGMADEAWNKRQIPGTPAFLINGALADGVSDWAALEPKIKAALK